MASEQFTIRLAVNSSGVASGINSAVGQINRLTNSVKNWLTVGAIGNEIRKVIAWASSINNARKEIGMSAEAFQANAYAAKQNSIEIEGLKKSYKALQLAQIAAITGEGGAREAFAAIGLSIEQLKRLNPEQLFEAVGRAFKTIPPSAQATSDAIKLLGKEGAAMASAFRNGFSDSAEEARALGLVVEESIVKELAKVGDEIDRLKTKWISFLAPGVAVLARFASAVSDYFNQFAGGVGTALGTIFGGGSFKDAFKATVDFIREEANKSAELQSKGEKQRSSITPEETDTQEKEKKTRAERMAQTGYNSQSDALRSIGIYRGGGELARVPQQQLEEQRRANSTLLRVAARIEDGNRIARVTAQNTGATARELTEEF